MGTKSRVDHPSPGPSHKGRGEGVSGQITDGSPSESGYPRNFKTLRLACREGVGVGIIDHLRSMTSAGDGSNALGVAVHDAG